MIFVWIVLAGALASCREGILDGDCFLLSCDVILDQVYCSVCTAMTEFLIDGQCLSTNVDNTCRHSFGNGTCDSCAGPYLSYRGGCYRVGEDPGNFICKSEDVFYVDGTALCRKCVVYGEFPIDGSCTKKAQGNRCGTTGYEGVCETCGTGYFYHNGGCYRKNRFPGNKICADSSAVEHIGHCGACLAGYETYKGTCLACEDINCRKCGVSMSNCEVCHDGYYLDRDMHDGKGACVPCNPIRNCETCLTDEECTSCARGFFAGFLKASGHCVSCDKGGDGYAGVPNCQVCLPPHPGTSDMAAFCTECAGGFYLLISEDRTQTSCVVSCPKNKIHYSNRCVTELEGCHSYGRNDECVKCVSGYRLAEGVCERCAVDNCEVCTSSSSVCNICKAGYGLESGMCNLCGEGCRTCDGDVSVCTTCLLRFNYISPGKNCCISTCPEHSHEVFSGELGFCECYGDYKPSADGLRCEK
ncbi:High cysteine protein [Giardia duodenalis]|uniref:High cysteine protein n=1 Tax=Giardia intestinalis (strain ATCC 50803 / WB clone C6) TaxID=184922 RepID=A8BAI1_GIAIC|nr:High cysteine protein [Giardia intestinalis]KAE8303496.1 High cysteine protein [Giardia intestinalis]|eukprot:XP_001708405.1 Variant-specific surface protein [Giardia lamblia ATCC 50803]